MHGRGAWSILVCAGDRKGRRRPWRLAIASALVVASAWACSRTGLYTSGQGHVALEVNTDVTMIALPEEPGGGQRHEVWVQGAPVTSGPVTFSW